jgi:RNA polymerase sigma factor (sigma-70 family)
VTDPAAVTFQVFDSSFVWAPMDDGNWFVEQFEKNRGHLRGVAYRMLGSLSEADDAVQETWLRLSRSDAGNIQNLSAWLTTVVARVCLDMLRSRTAQAEEPLETHLASVAKKPSTRDTEQETLLADSVGVALLVVLDRLKPAERLAFVLHDVFAVPFEEIAAIVDRTPEAVRQLASRARRRVQAKESDVSVNLSEQRKVVDAFLTALQNGDFEGLVAVLDPDVVVHIDPAAGAPGAPRELRGARNWAHGAVAFSHVARFAQPALIDGSVGIVVAPQGKLSRVLRFTIANGRIVQAEIIAEPARLRELDLAVL